MINHELDITSLRPQHILIIICDEKMYTVYSMFNERCIEDTVLRVSNVLFYLPNQHKSNPLSPGRIYTNTKALSFLQDHQIQNKFNLGIWDPNHKITMLKL